MPEYDVEYSYVHKDHYGLDSRRHLKTRVNADSKRDARRLAREVMIVRQNKDYIVGKATEAKP